MGYNPPVCEKLWVQKLPTVDENGNNVIVKIKYLPDIRLKPILLLKIVDDNTIVSKDDGVYPDAIARDLIYTCVIKENIPKFQSQLLNIENSLIAQKKVIKYEGHKGSVIDVSNLEHFDVNRFNQGFEVELSSAIVLASDCPTSILKEKSLLITDLSVVEDPARTFNVVSSTGNPQGCWTFGQMIKNIANESYTNVSAKEMIKQWLKSYAYDEYIDYGLGFTETLKAREDVFIHLISPWLIKCQEVNPTINNPGVALYTNSVFGYTFYLDPNNILDGKQSIIKQINNATNNDPLFWETVLDNTSESDLLKYAPFKLMAIVNRLDLRSNHQLPIHTLYEDGVTNTMINSGETRFIFTLIDLYKNRAYGEAGGIPYHVNQDFVGNAPKTDWEGFNVIFEYGNTCKNLCEMVQHGQDWLNLSDMGGASDFPSFPLPINNDPITFTDAIYNAQKVKSDNYNAALQLITDKVTAVNSHPLRYYNNRSAINRIRTNEKLFATTLASDALTWNDANWELRQFEIGANKCFQRVGVTNVPNTAANTNVTNTNNNLVSFIGNNVTPNTPNNTNLLQWAYNPSNQSAVAKGTHNIPLLPVHNRNVFRAASALVTAEQFTSFDLWPDDENVFPNDSIKNYIPQYGVLLPKDIYFKHYKEIRNGISMQTCQGCHAGDNKTFFTQIHPRGYGQTAIYWQGIPDNILANIDIRFNKNKGNTMDYNIGGGITPNYYVPGLETYQQYIPVVSSFITGIAVNGDFTTGVKTGDDNLTDGTDNFLDINPDINHLTFGGNQFYVNDPSNAYPKTKFGVEMLNGFNELDRRKEDLCKVVQTNCTQYEVMYYGNHIIQLTKFVFKNHVTM